MGTMRRQLIEMREEKGLTREALAHRLGCNVRSVTRWETGERTPQMAQRVALAHELGRPLADVLRALEAHDDSPVNGHRVPATLTMFASLEQAATELRTWEPLAVPGLLQTAAYATAVERSSVARPTEAEIAKRVEFRLARQRAILREREPLRLFALLDASVLVRETGGPAVMVDQLDHLRAMAQRPNVEVRVTPLDGRVFAAPGAFRLLSGDALVPFIACTSNVAGVQYHEGAEIVRAYAELFDHLWRAGDELEKVELLDSQQRLRRAGRG